MCFVFISLYTVRFLYVRASRLHSRMHVPSSWVDPQWLCSTQAACKTHYCYYYYYYYYYYCCCCCCYYLLLQLLLQLLLLLRMMMMMITTRLLTKFSCFHPSSNTIKLYLPLPERGWDLMPNNRLCRTQERNTKIKVRSTEECLLRLAIQTDKGYIFL